jgi:hypothetical protein
MASKEVELKKSYISRLHNAFAESKGKIDMMSNRIRTIKKNWSELYTLINLNLYLFSFQMKCIKKLKIFGLKPSTTGSRTQKS